MNEKVPTFMAGDTITVTIPPGHPKLFHFPPGTYHLKVIRSLESKPFFVRLLLNCRYEPVSSSTVTANIPVGPDTTGDRLFLGRDEYALDFKHEQNLESRLKKSLQKHDQRSRKDKAPSGTEAQVQS